MLWITKRREMWEVGKMNSVMSALGATILAVFFFSERCPREDGFKIREIQVCQHPATQPWLQGTVFSI